MGETSSDLQTALEQARKAQEDLDRKVFYLKTLFDTSMELAGLIQPKRILDSFLLMTMGPLGITHGFAALINTKTGQGHVTGRGMSAGEADAVEGNLPLICKRYFARRDLQAGAVPRVQFITRESVGDHHFFPPQTSLLILWSLTGEYSGLLGLGGKISGKPFEEGDLDLLLNATNLLTGALSQALSVLNIQQLNADLLKKNSALEDALGEVRQSREELDKRIFHLKSLSDLNSELSPIFNTDGVLQAFLMTSMGSLGVRQGIVLVYDRESRVPRLAVRGLDDQPVLDEEACEKLLYRSFDASENKTLTPMNMSRITDPLLFSEAGIGIDAILGFFFVIDHTFMGAVAFGPPIIRTSFSAEEVELLATQTSSFMVFLKNTKAFETIQALNKDLTRRNEELRQTIEELTEARYKITLLERARARIRSLIQGEVERVGRASALDFILILLLAVSIGALFNLVNPQGVPLLQESVLRPHTASVTPDEAKRMIEEQKAVLVDARPKELYDQRHIIGAINVPLALFDIIYMMKLSSLDPGRPVIVYGRNISRLYDEELAFRLKMRDHDTVKVLSGGLHAWEGRGYPVE